MDGRIRRFCLMCIITERNFFGGDDDNDDDVDADE